MVVTRLTSGVRVVMVPMGGVESLAVGVFINAGSRDETEKTNGVAHFLEHVAFRGTKSFSNRDKTAVLEGLGGIQNGWTSSDATCFWAKVTADNWSVALQLQMELALEPVIRAADIESERKVITEEINRRNESPDEKVWEELGALQFGDTPLGRSTLGTVETINSMKREDLLGFHNWAKTGDKLVVVLAGKLPEKQTVLESVEKWTEVVEGQTTTTRMQPRFETAPKVRLLVRPDAGQTQLVLGVKAFSILDKRRYALMVLDSILGDGLSGRLFKSVRDEKGLAYAIGSEHDLEYDYGSFVVYAGVKNTRVNEAVSAIVSELSRMVCEPVGEHELSLAKQKNKGPFYFAMENPYHQMQFFGKQALVFGEKVISAEERVEAVMQVTAQDVQQVAKDIFRDNNMYLAVVGPESRQMEGDLVELLHV